eukprot:gene10201-13725_t
MLRNNESEENYPFEDWNQLHYATSVGSIESVQNLLANGFNINSQNKSKVIPQVTPLHIAVRQSNAQLVSLLVESSIVNVQDQWGFSPLHYAVIVHNRQIVQLLLSNGASAVISSKNGSTPLDLANSLHYDDIIDILSSKMKLEQDPSYPKFKEWLSHLGAGEYSSKFLQAGYDLPFIAKHGLAESDLDCVGIPLTKLGIRRKIIALHNLNDFYDAHDDDNEDDEDEENGDNEESEDDYDSEEDED